MVIPKSSPFSPYSTLGAKPLAYSMLRWWIVAYTYTPISAAPSPVDYQPLFHG